MLATARGTPMPQNIAVDESSTRKPWSKFSIHATSEVPISLCAQGIRQLSPGTTDTMENVIAAAAYDVGASAAAAWCQI